MYLVLVTALVAVCGADKLDRTYLPPASANTAGGSPGSLQTPFRSFNQGLGGLPKGGYSNDFEGVVVDAAAPGTRASGSDETGLGAPRIVYGSSNSKVGEAAFTAAFPRVGVHSGPIEQPSGLVSGSRFPGPASPERIQASRDRASNTVKYENDVSHDSFKYAFETENGIVAEGNGVEVNGVNAQGGYSYTGDDGQVYSVTYTADEGGYRPRGNHLPTPPPIPEEILKSLEQNAKDEAAGVTDDGSYDTQKYNADEDYTKSDSSNEKYIGEQPSRLGSRPQSDADASGSFISQNNQGFVKPNSHRFGAMPINSYSTVANGFQSFDASKNDASSGNGIISNFNKGFQNGQAHVFGSISNKEYLPPSSFNQGHRLTLNMKPQGIHNDLQNELSQDTPSIPDLNNIADANKHFNNQLPNAVPLSQQQLQNDISKKPEISSSVFGKPTVIDSTLSIKDPFVKRPSSNQFNQNTQFSHLPQVSGQTGGSFKVVSGNVYSSKKDYLPPLSQFNNNQKGNYRFPVGSSGIFNSPTASAFASVSRPTFPSFSPFQQYSGPQSPQLVFNDLPSQVNQIKEKNNLNLPRVPGSNIILNSKPQFQPPVLAPQFPTLQPHTLLTTPLESNSNPIQGLAPLPVPVGSDLPSISSTSFSNLPSFGAQPANNFLDQSSFNTNKIQNISPTQSSAHDYSSIGGQSTASSHSKLEYHESNVGGPSKMPFDVKYSSTTLKPSISQTSLQKESDNSYYYNKPSKPFNVPTVRPQISRFPSSAFDQPFRVTQTSFSTRPTSLIAPHTSFTSQSSKLLENTKYTGSPNPNPVSPTLPSKQSDYNSNIFQSEVNRVTQASASSFPSPVPTVSVDVHRNQFNSQFGTRVTQQTKPQNDKENQSLLNQPSTLFAQASAETQLPVNDQETNNRLSGLSKPDSSQSSQSQTQQYNSEIYEYKKPTQTLPVPQNNAGLGQISQMSVFNLPGSQLGQSQNFGAYKPSSQFENKYNVQTPSSFAQKPYSHISQGNKASNFNAQVQSQPQYDLKPGLFGSFTSKFTQNSQVDKENEEINSNDRRQPQTQSEPRPEPFGSLPSHQNQEHSYNGQEQIRPQADSVPGQDDVGSSNPTQISTGLQVNQGLNFDTQQQHRPHSESKPDKFDSRPSAQSQSTRPIQGASKFPPTYNKEGPSCCKQANFGSQSSQSNQQNQPPQFDGQFVGNQANKEGAAPQDIKPPFSVSSFASVGESFGGPRKPPSFDESGYHY